MSKLLRDEVFDLAVIDEAAQAMEASCFIPVLRSRRLVLAGDHKQLAPTIKSAKALKMGLGVTLFDRLMARLGGSHARMLNIQYRMHAAICGWASQEMYGGELVPAEGVAHRLLSGLDYVTGAEDMTLAPLLLLDTAGCGMEEEEETQECHGCDSKGERRKKLALLQGGSRSNTGEAKVVEAHVRALLGIGLHQEDIAVITPYNAQVSK